MEGGRKGEEMKKRIKMCHKHAPTLHEEYNHHVLQTCTNNIFLIKKNEQQEKSKARKINGMEYIATYELCVYFCYYLSKQYQLTNVIWKHVQ